MKKLLTLFFILFLFSCKKDDITNNESAITIPAASTISLTKQNCGYISFFECKFSYTDINGVIYQNVEDDDNKIENVDFSKPFSCNARAGYQSYYVGGGTYTTYQTCDYILKKDGTVIDIQTVINYSYQN